LGHKQKAGGERAAPLSFFAGNRNENERGFYTMKTGNMRKTAFAAAAALLFFLSAGAVWAADSDVIRLGVMKFSSKASGVSDSQAEIITDIFTRVLANSKTIAVLEREQLSVIGKEHKLNMSGLVDMSLAIEVGRLAGCQYMLLGSVTELSEKVSGGFIPIGGIGIGGGSHDAKATIDMRIVDVATSEIVLSLSESGTSSESSQAISIQGMSWGESNFGGLKERALAASASRLAHKIREELGGEYSHTLSSGGKNVQINLGATSGVKPGDLYLIYADGKAVLDIDGRVMERERINIAVLKVTDVRSGYSVGDVVPDGGDSRLVQRGQKIEPISKERAKDISKRKAFARDVPKASSGTFEQIFGEGGVSAEAPGASAAVSPSSPAVTPARGSAVPQKTVKDFDPNGSTDAKVIQTYPISSGEANILGVKQRNAYNKYRNGRYKDAYAEFSAAANEYKGHYLAAYWAGRTAQNLKKKDDARAWFDKALAINPGYKPALEAKAKLK
jgi:curli biogenesis system outer membrane secretion channel CsgG